jgi:hypothetical protein
MLAYIEKMSMLVNDNVGQRLEVALPSRLAPVEDSLKEIKENTATKSDIDGFWLELDQTLATVSASASSSSGAPPLWLIREKLLGPLLSLLLG